MSTPPSPLAVPPGDGQRVQLFGVRFRYKVDHAASGGNLAILKVVIPPHTLVKPHTHTREDEYTLVREGTVGVRIGDETLEGAPGAYLVKPRDIPHAMWNAGDEPATVVEILSPAGAEKYFEELAPVLERHDPPETYYALAGKYGLTINDEWDRGARARVRRGSSERGGILCGAAVLDGYGTARGLRAQQAAMGTRTGREVRGHRRPRGERAARSRGVADRGDHLAGREVGQAPQEPGDAGRARRGLRRHRVEGRAPDHPVWYHNFVAHPEVELQDGPEPHLYAPGSPRVRNARSGGSDRSSSTRRTRSTRSRPTGRSRCSCSSAFPRTARRPR